MLNSEEAEIQAQVAWLQMIQAIITRMSNYGFMLKGWGVTLVSALLALAVTEHASPNLVLIGFVPIVIFWGLDGWFLQTETRFRNLYDWAATQSATEKQFAIKPSHIGVVGVRHLLSYVFSLTLSPFWCALGFVCLIVWIGLT